MNTPLVSIIMPVYNADRFLKTAIDSVLNQDLQDWELICIDDGSFDKSGAVLDEYASMDARIRVIHQSNKGISATRQLGVSLANGVYMIQIDSDDWVESNYLSFLYGKAKESNSDMVWCDCTVNGEDRWSMSCKENPVLMIKKLLNQELWGTIWNRMIRTSICKDRRISFPINCTMWEDLAFVIQCLSLCTIISYVNMPLYHYRQVGSSLVHTQSNKNISAEHRKAIDHIENFLTKIGTVQQYKYELRKIKLFAIRDFIDDLRFRDYEKFMTTYPDAIAHIWEYKEYPFRLKSCSWVLRHNLDFFVPLICKIDSIFRKLGITKQY